MANNRHGNGGFGRYTRVFTLFLVGAVASTAAVSAKERHAKSESDPSQDQIQVIAHVPLTNGPVTRFLTTQHHRRDYLYAEHASGAGVTLIDVTNTARPAVLGYATYAANGAAEVMSVTGNAALVATSNSVREGSSVAPQTYRIMSFADPLHPTVKQEFDGVTAMATDDKRGLVFLANSDGIWILEERHAPDPEFEKEWEHMMLDNR